MDLIEKAKSYYRAFERHEPDFIRGEMAGGFTFTSPFDDHIGCDEYFRRCWPEEPLHWKFDFVAAARDGDRVTVVYECHMHRANAVHPDMHFRNAEMLTFEGGRFKSVEVFFGDPPGRLSRREFAVRSGAA
jgi:hypothetical protein